MPRYHLVLEYDGRSFNGWQAQKGHPSVQAAMEQAAAAIAETPVQIVGAGRTDSGVHATGQSAHLDLEKTLAPAKLADALNFHLRPAPIAVLRANIAPDDFHARFDAVFRRYRYRIVNRRADLAIDRGLAWRMGQKLDAGAMHDAAQALLGHHDFTTFRDAQCQAASPVKTLEKISVEQSGDHIDVLVGARSFLHRQVRSIVGSLVEVGRGKRPVRWMGDILAEADRAACGPVAPPDGLYLTEVVYPD
ncbi:MAG: tRNA pseudouridine(38-40) synthase TruA [Pseudomonadota bacterium]